MLTKNDGRGNSVTYGANPITDYCTTILDNGMRLDAEDVLVLQKMAKKYRRRAESFRGVRTIPDLPTGDKRIVD